jgi:hypothetical protein
LPCASLADTSTSQGWKEVRGVLHSKCTHPWKYCNFLWIRTDVIKILFFFGMRRHDTWYIVIKHEIRSENMYTMHIFRILYFQLRLSIHI